MLNNHDDVPSVRPLDKPAVFLTKVLDNSSDKCQHIVLPNTTDATPKMVFVDVEGGFKKLTDRTETDPVERTEVPNDMVLKNTLKKVFWDKINDHVEELLTSMEESKRGTPDSVSTEKEPPKQPAISTKPPNRVVPILEQVLDGSTKKRPQNRSANSTYATHRKSMLEIASPEIEDNLISIFRRNMHCTDSCIIRVVDMSGISRQSHFNRTIPMVCIDRALLEDNMTNIHVQYMNCLRITRMQNPKCIDVFNVTDVFAKRSVIKGGDILRTLAVYEMREKFDFQEQSALDRETRKVMYNKFTNMQRLDRGVGSRLKWQFMDRHNIEETDTIQTLEEKADVSFSIFGYDGFLVYESKKYRLKHVTMIKDVVGLYYFIPQKMLSAFGSQWSTLKRRAPSRKDDEDICEKDSFMKDVGSEATQAFGFHPSRMRIKEELLEPRDIPEKAIHIGNVWPIFSGSPRPSAPLCPPRIPNTDTSTEEAPTVKLSTGPSVKASSDKIISTKLTPDKTNKHTDQSVKSKSDVVNGETIPSSTKSDRTKTKKTKPISKKRVLSEPPIVVTVKRISPTVGVGFRSKKKVYHKGEVLLTTKDHIILRIPRNNPDS